MREIKFRGWDLDTKRWYYGSYVRLERTTPYPISPDPEGDKKKFEAEQVDHYVFFTEMNDWGLETKKLRASVDPKSVGQYTGLKDKNGVEIYEGTVLRSFTAKKVPTGRDVEGLIVVQWEDMIDDESREGIGVGFNIHNYMLGEDRYGLSPYEVIGNTYENPELLPEGQQ